MAAREDGASSNRKVEEDSSPEAAEQMADETLARTAEDQKADETVARTGDVQKTDETVARMAAHVGECSDDDEDDPVIQNLNLMSRRNLMTPEWIENRKKRHYEQIALFNSVYDSLENGDLETDYDDEAIEAIGKGIWASVDLSGLNTVGGESCGMDAVAVYPVGVCPPKSQSEEENHDAAAAAAESSS